MSVSIFLVLVLFLSSSCASPLNDNCTSMARSGDCDFYSQCVEKHIPCGPDGYALGYAGKYCVKFGKYADCFNEGGQEWIQNVRICLETNLVNSSVYLHNGTCDQLLQFGFSTHPHCYLVNGFCNVILKSITNLWCLTKVFDAKDFFSKLALKQVYDTVKNCTNESTFTLSKYVNDMFGVS